MATGARYGYKDLSHSEYRNSLRAHNHHTLQLVNTVADFAEQLSAAHEDFAHHVQNLVEQYRNRNLQLLQDSIEDVRLPESDSSLVNTWENLLQETQYDAQAHADTATLMLKNVHAPLVEIASYKKNQGERVMSFRESCETVLSNSAENLTQIQHAYMEAYERYRGNSRDPAASLAEYHNQHNEYVLKLRAANRQERCYQEVTLPALLEELEEINIDVATTLNGSIEIHVLLLVTKANEQARRFDGLLRLCKQINPKEDIQNYLNTICPPCQTPLSHEARLHAFQDPCSDPTVPGSELAALPAKIVQDKQTEPVLNIKRQELQKEAAELTSYLRQNHEDLQSLMNACQRNLANHLYNKVYETQDDLCRKRNDIRMAHLQLASIWAQIELLSGKPQNGSGVEGIGLESGSDMDNPSSGKNAGKASIKDMWKKAFTRLKKDPKTGGNGVAGGSGTSGEGVDSSGSAASTPLSETPSDRSNPRRMVSQTSSLSESDYSTGATPSSLRRTQSEIPSPKRAHPSAASLSSIIGRTSRQSSVKKGFFRKDSKESPREDQEAQEDNDTGAIDPVYSLLKCAADRSRSGVMTPTGGGAAKHVHACCPRMTSGTAPGEQTAVINSLNTNNARTHSSRSPSPASDYDSVTLDFGNSSMCSCPCHTPEVLEDYHRPILASFKYYLPKIDKR